MITELNNADFYKCRELLNKNGQLEANAIIEGINPGRVFVDDVEAPTSGLIWLGNDDGFIFIGNENNEAFNHELNAFIDQTITPEALKVGLQWFEGVGNHPNWNATIEKALRNRELGSWNQRVYTLHKLDYTYNHELIIDPVYEVVKISKQLYENKDNAIHNIDFLHSKILEFWDSPEMFFTKGLGYGVLYKNQLVSICFSGFVVGNVHCIDIETLKEHQGKKLAQTIAQSFAEDCLLQHLIPYWDCMESNKPSIAVAENIGFKLAFNYKGYEFRFENV
jgi:hypothetical protein